MAKIRVMGVRVGQGNHTIYVVLVEPEQVGEETQETPLGEASVTIAEGTTPAMVKKQIVNAAQGIMERSKEAKRIREKLQQVDFPEIT